eukprot:gene2079-2798_t
MIDFFSIDIVGGAPVDIAQEAQGDVVVGRIDPARPGQSAPMRRQGRSDLGMPNQCQFFVTLARRKAGQALPDGAAPRSSPDQGQGLPTSWWIASIPASTSGDGVTAIGAMSVTVTLSLMLAVYGVVNGNEAGWGSTQTVGLLGAAVVLLAVFIAIEARVQHPLMPLGLFRLRSVSVANVVGVLWAAAMFAWFFISALYMQLVLQYTPMQIGLAFLPANIIMAVFSLGLSAKIVMRFGIRKPLAAGLWLAASGLALCARAPVNGSFVVDVLPGMMLLGLVNSVHYAHASRGTISTVS